MSAVDREELRSRIGHLLRVKGTPAMMAKYTNALTSATLTYHAGTMSGWPDKADLLDDAKVSVVGGTKSGETRQVTSFTSSGGSPGITCVSFSGALGADSDCEVWRFGLDADLVNEAIDMGITETGISSLVLTQNMTLATESDRSEYPLPTTGLDAIYKVELYNATPIVGISASEATTARKLFDVNNATRLARKITLTAGQTIWGYLIHLSKVGSPTITLTAQLYDDSSGLPGSTISGTSATMLTTTLVETGEPRYYVFKLTKPYRVTTTGTYHLALSSSQGALDATNYVEWSEDGSSSETDVLERYNGSAWSAVSGSDLVFQVIPNTKGDWVEWPAWAWLLERDSPVKLAFRTNKQVETDLGGSVLFGEGHVIRILGYRRPALPTADTDTVEVNPNYVLNEAITYLLTGMVGGPGVDPDDYARQVSIWQRKAELGRGEHHVRLRVHPNTTWLTENWR